MSTNFTPPAGVTSGGASPAGNTIWGTGGIGLVNTTNLAPTGAAGTGDDYVNRDGFDLVWVQAGLQTQMASIEANIDTIENNANLSDTEKMYSMQMAMNTWSAVSTLRTNIMKSVSDTLQGIVRNVTT